MARPEASSTDSKIELRFEVRPSDAGCVRRIVANTDYFREDEVGVAVELVDERLHKGEASGYDFVFAESNGDVVGYACYGPIPCTISSFDLYWIAVEPGFQNRGVGQLLMQAAEAAIRDSGGRQIFIDTSGRPKYAPTRAFYQRCGYEIAATLADFYAEGDDKVILRKRFGDSHGNS
jgi:ribosomal protein S18 acetylase RimI-like enzyme